MKNLGLFLTFLLIFVSCNTKSDITLQSDNVYIHISIPSETAQVSKSGLLPQQKIQSFDAKVVINGLDLASPIVKNFTGLKEGNNTLSISVPVGGKRFVYILITAEGKPLYVGGTSFNAVNGEPINVSMLLSKAFYTLNFNNYYPTKTDYKEWENAKDKLSSQKLYIDDIFITFSPLTSVNYHYYFDSPEPNKEYEMYYIDRFDLSGILSSVSIDYTPFYYAMVTPDNSIQFFKDTNGYYLYNITVNEVLLEIYAQRINFDSAFSSYNISTTSPVYQTVSNLTPLSYFDLKLYFEDGNGYYIPYFLSFYLGSSSSFKIDKNIKWFSPELPKYSMLGTNIIKNSLFPLYQVSNTNSISFPAATQTETYSLSGDVFAFAVRTYRTNIKSKLDYLEDKTFGINFGFKNLKDYNTSSMLIAHNPEGSLGLTSLNFEYLNEPDISKQAIILKSSGDIFVIQNPSTNIQGFNETIKGYKQNNKYMFEIKNNTDFSECNLYCDSFNINDINVDFVGELLFGVGIRNYLKQPFDVVYRDVPVNMLFVDDPFCNANIIVECMNEAENKRIIKFFSNNVSTGIELDPYFDYPSNFSIISVAPLQDATSGAIAIYLSSYNPPTAKPECYFSAASNSEALSIGCSYIETPQILDMGNLYYALKDIASISTNVSIIGTIYMYFPIYNQGTTYKGSIDVERIEADENLSTTNNFTLTWLTSSFSNCQTGSLFLSYIDNTYNLENTVPLSNTGSYTVTDNGGKYLFLHCLDTSGKIVFKRFITP